MSEFSPREIVSELSRFIVGQDDAKRAVAVALRNRWRRSRLADPLLRSEITPKNILMIGPTGVGKTEMSRRLAKLVQAPFLKVEATRFTEVGYVGRDVDQIIRDLLEQAITMTRGQRHETVRARAERAAESRILRALSDSGIDAPREEYRAGRFDDSPVTIEVEDTSSPLQTVEIPGQPGIGMGALNLNDVLGKAFGGRKRSLRTSVADARKPLIEEESDKLIDSDAIVREAIEVAENDGIVFIDEIDKVARPDRGAGGDVSREGVQRDLLPMIEGTTVSTRHGSVNTDHILFIASGAFHVAKPSDLLPELQGRLPIRVELSPLTEADFQRILTEPEASLIQQYTALIGVDKVELSFDAGAIEAIAAIATRVNEGVENIGARRLHTVMEKLLEDISFNAPDMSGTQVTIDSAYVNDRLDDLASDTDVSRYIL